MKNYLFICIILIFNVTVFAQNKTPGENKTVVVKSESGWNKSESDYSPQNQAVTVDGVTYTARQDGILITLPKSVNKVKLFALTGETVWSGDLVQGKFFIPTKAGIYFLRINNKSYKVVCK